MSEFNQACASLEYELTTVTDEWIGSATRQEKEAKAESITEFYDNVDIAFQRISWTKLTPEQKSKATTKKSSIKKRKAKAGASLQAAILADHIKEHTQAIRDENNARKTELETLKSEQKN